MRALLIVNPSAGHRTAGPDDLERAIAVIRDAGIEVECAETALEHPNSADLARRAIAERFDACIVAGGDGTVQPAAAALLDTAVVLGILPFGSFMNIAHGLGIPLARSTRRRSSRTVARLAPAHARAPTEASPLHRREDHDDLRRADQRARRRKAGGDVGGGLCVPRGGAEGIRVRTGGHERSF